MGSKPSWLGVAGGSLFVTDMDDGTVRQIDVRSGKKVGLPIRISRSTKNAPAPSVAPAGPSVWVGSFASNMLTRINSTVSPGRPVGKITVRISGGNDKQQGDHVTNGGKVPGAAHFVASGAISDRGTVVTHRTEKPPLITLRYVTSGSKGTITFLVKIQTNLVPVTSRWTITAGTGAYQGLHGEGIESDTAHYTVQTLTGTVSP